MALGNGQLFAVLNIELPGQPSSVIIGGDFARCVAMGNRPVAATDRVVTDQHGRVILPGYVSLGDPQVRKARVLDVSEQAHVVLIRPVDE